MLHPFLLPPSSFPYNLIIVSGFEDPDADLLGVITIKHTEKYWLSSRSIAVLQTGTVLRKFGYSEDHQKTISHLELFHFYKYLVEELHHRTEKDTERFFREGIIRKYGITYLLPFASRHKVRWITTEIFMFHGLLFREYSFEAFVLGEYENLRQKGDFSAQGFLPFLEAYCHDWKHDMGDFWKINAEDLLSPLNLRVEKRKIRAMSDGAILVPETVSEVRGIPGITNPDHALPDSSPPQTRDIPRPKTKPVSVARDVKGVVCSATIPGETSSDSEDVENPKTLLDSPPDRSSGPNSSDSPVSPDPPRSNSSVSPDPPRTNSSDSPVPSVPSGSPVLPVSPDPETLNLIFPIHLARRNVLHFVFRSISDLIEKASLEGKVKVHVSYETHPQLKSDFVLRSLDTFRQANYTVELVHDGIEISF